MAGHEMLPKRPAGERDRARRHTRSVSAVRGAASLGFPLEEHLQYFLEVRPQFVKRRTLAVCARKPRHPPDVEARFGVSFDHCCEVLHRDVLSEIA